MGSILALEAQSHWLLAKAKVYSLTLVVGLMEYITSRLPGANLTCLVLLIVKQPGAGVISFSQPTKAKEATAKSKNSLFFIVSINLQFTTIRQKNNHNIMYINCFYNTEPTFSNANIQKKTYIITLFYLHPRPLDPSCFLGIFNPNGSLCRASHTQHKHIRGHSLGLQSVR